MPWALIQVPKPNRELVPAQASLWHNTKVSMTASVISWFATLLLLSNGALITLQQEEGPELNNCFPSAGNYTPNSQYETNLRRILLPSLASNATLNYTSYYSTVVGRGADQIFGFAQCMFASSVDDCRNCLNRSVTAITTVCSNSLQAYIRYEDCILRYSNRSFVSQLDTSISIHYVNPDNATDPALFLQRMGDLMRNLSTEAARSPSRLAAWSAPLTNVQRIYGLTECTRDISSSDCFTCLDGAIQRLISRIGARFYFPSCNLRYETTAFYPADGLTPPPPDPSSPGSDNTSPPPRESSPDQSIPNGQGNSNNRTRNIIIGVVVGTASLLVIVIIFVWWLARRNRHVGGLIAESKSESTIDESKGFLFDLNEIRGATNDFSEANKLGQGGFGPVYKGTVADGRQIAVKRLLASSSQGITELKNEVALLAKLQHRNLVKLLGCCLENQEKLLVYEFVPKSSLDKFLFDPVKKNELKWDLRFKIIGGIARGLLYLHEDSRLRIIHRDLKAGNILLDGEMNAKISDFGLAKIFGADQTQGNTSRIAGTFGYMAPEYILHGQFSTKSDVFSFGVLVLEIVTGRKCSGYSESGNSIDLLSHVWRHWTNGSIAESIDETLNGYPVNEVVRCVHIGLLCVQEDATERPTMSNVVLMLSSLSLTLSAPSPPAFCSNFTSNNSYSSPSPLWSSHKNIREPALNEVSVSDVLYPR